MPTVLDDIIVGVREDLEDRRRATSLQRIRENALQASPARDAWAALRGGRSDASGLRVISEVKRSSPSKGVLADISAPADLARSYQCGGASVISVLTERRRFGGSLADLDAVRAAVEIPVLRKDFTVDEYQIHEARAHGADLVLLIVAALDDHQLKDFLDLTHELGMNALVEAHTPEEIERAAALQPRIIGVNVRNLKTLEVDPSSYGRLAPLLPADVVQIAESGVDGPQDAAEYARHGADAILVGEALVRHGDPARAIQDFRAAASAAVR